MHLAVIGTGSMGGAIANALLKSGVTVTVFNRTRAKAAELAQFGARVADDPAQAMVGVDGAIFALTNAQAVQALLDGPLRARPLTCQRALSVSVLTPSEFHKLESGFLERGVRLSEVAVGAYPEHVRNLQADCLLAAASEDKAFWTSVIQMLGTCLELDAPGDASKAYMALCIPYMFLPLAAAYSIGVFERLGLPTGIIPGIWRSNPTIASESAAILADEMLKKNYHRAQFSIDNFIEMSEQVITFSRELKMDTEILKMIRDSFIAVSDKGMGGFDVPAIIEYLR